MLKGIDISHHNYHMQDYDELNKLDFVIMKASEGVKFRDPKMRNYLGFLNPFILRGFYHYARPDLGNKPEDEAQHFINTVRPFINGRSVLALDVEDLALKVKDLDWWVSVWCQVVEMETGIKPLIYCSAAECKRFKAAADMGCGLWVAKWSANKPTEKQIKPWGFWAFWQYSSDGVFSGARVDLDYFNGDELQFIKYAEVKHGSHNSDNSGDQGSFITSI